MASSVSGQGGWQAHSEAHTHPSIALTRQPRATHAARAQPGALTQGGAAMDAAAPALALSEDQVERPTFDYVFNIKV